MENNSLESKRIWVTGASKGIGAAIAEMLLDKVAFVALTAQKESSFGDKINLFSLNPKAFIAPCNILSEKEIAETYQKIENRCGGVDILINNAGTAVFKDFKNTSIEDFDRMSETNFRGTFLCTKAVLSKMIENKRGIIINIISVSAIETFTKSSIYAGTKAAVLAMSRSLRQEVRSDGIKIIDILPGATQTSIWSEKVSREHGWRMLQPSDVASVVLNTIDLCLNDRLMVEEIIVKPQLGNL
jgi:short-subunit dehydrogenase